MSKDKILDAMRQAAANAMTAEQTVRLYGHDHTARPRYFSIEHRERDSESMSMLNGRVVENKGYTSTFERGVTICSLVGDDEIGYGSARAARSGDIPGGEKGLLKILSTMTDDAFKAANDAYLDSVKEGLRVVHQKGENFTHISNDPASRHHERRPRKKHIPSDAVCMLKKWTAQMNKRTYVTEATAVASYSHSARRFADSEKRAILDFDFQGFFSISVELKHKDNTSMVYSDHISLIKNWRTTRPLLEDLLKSTEEYISEMRTSVKVRTDRYPILLSHAGTGALFHEGGAGHLLSGEGIKNGTTTTYKDKIGRLILPKFLTLIDDPTEADSDMNYKFDSEGIRAKRVILVKNGMLRKYLHNRNSAGYFGMRSSGHARIGWVVDEEGDMLHSEPRASNLIIESSKTIPDSEMLDYMRTYCRDNNIEFGLYVDPEGGEVLDDWGIFGIVPKRAWKVYPDGKMRAARNFVLVGSPDDLLNRILLTGDTLKRSSGDCGSDSGDVPVEFHAPMAFIRSAQINAYDVNPDTPPAVKRMR